MLVLLLVLISGNQLVMDGEELAILANFQTQRHALAYTLALNTISLMYLVLSWNSDMMFVKTIIHS